MTAVPPRPAASGVAAMAAGWARLFRVEDVVLAIVAAIGLPLLGLLGGSGDGSTGGGAGEPGVLAGALGLLAIAGVVACLCTRGPGEPAPLADSTMTLQGWARFPLAAGVGITAIETLPGLGLPADPIVGAVFVVMMVTAIAHPRLPVVPVPVRRAMVLPITMLAAGAFNATVGGDLPDLVGGFVDGSAPPEIVAFAPLIIAAIGTFYVMLVVAPRAIADPGSSGLAWLLRFLLLLASAAVGSAIVA